MFVSVIFRRCGTRVLFTGLRSITHFWTASFPLLFQLSAGSTSRSEHFSFLAIYRNVSYWPNILYVTKDV
uniref:Uncharacterized protein n=1 Tax=Anguilla anguilla TaxID=7936 RepID=A0A0E9TPT4_ANGAN